MFGFGKTTGPDYDKRKRDARTPGVARSERRQLKKLNKREADRFNVQVAKSKFSSAIDNAGRIKVQAAFNAIPEWRQRLKEGRCICGLTADKKGTLCGACVKEIGRIPETHTKGNSNVPAGQNLLGIVYCDMGHRVWPDHAGNIPECTDKAHYL